MWRETIKVILEHPIIATFVGTILAVGVCELVRWVWKNLSKDKKTYIDIRQEKVTLYRNLYQELTNIEEIGAYQFASKYKLAYESLDCYLKEQIPADLTCPLGELCKKLNQLRKHSQRIATRLYQHLGKERPSIVKGDANSLYLSFAPDVVVGDRTIEERVLDVYRKSPEEFLEEIQASIEIYPEFIISPDKSRFTTVTLTKKMFSELKELKNQLATIQEISLADKLDNEITQKAEQIKRQLKKYIK